MECSSAQLCEDLVTLVKHVKAAMAKIAERHGLTNMQFYAMNVVQHSGVATMGGVAHSLHCDASNITGIIDRLVALDLITRRENADDRRAKLLELTPKGNEAIEKIIAELPEELGCNKFKAPERTQLHELIMRIVV